MTDNELYILKIDTDSYSGNFEREMIAYSTGLYCIRGERETQDFIDTYGEEKSWEIADYAIMVRDPRDDDRRPEYAHIDITPGIYNNGLGFHYKEGQELEALEAYKKSCLDEAQRALSIYAHMPEYGEERAQEWENKAKDANLGNLNKFGAFQTVMLHFKKRPPQDIIELLKSRCLEYAAIPSGRDGSLIQITGFRLVKRQITVQETEEKV